MIQATQSDSIFNSENYGDRLELDLLGVFTCFSFFFFFNLPKIRVRQICMQFSILSLISSEILDKLLNHSETQFYYHYI